MQHKYVYLIDHCTCTNYITNYCNKLIYNKYLQLFTISLRNNSLISQNFVKRIMIF